MENLAKNYGIYRLLQPSGQQRSPSIKRRKPTLHMLLAPLSVVLAPNGVVEKQRQNTLSRQASTRSRRGSASKQQQQQQQQQESATVKAFVASTTKMLSNVVQKSDDERNTAGTSTSNSTTMAAARPPHARVTAVKSLRWDPDNDGNADEPEVKLQIPIVSVKEAEQKDEGNVEQPFTPKRQLETIRIDKSPVYKCKSRPLPTSDFDEITVDHQEDKCNSDRHAPLFASISTPSPNSVQRWSSKSKLVTATLKIQPHATLKERSQKSYNGSGALCKKTSLVISENHLAQRLDSAHIETLDSNLRTPLSRRSVTLRKSYCTGRPLDSAQEADDVTEIVVEHEENKQQVTETVGPSAADCRSSRHLNDVSSELDPEVLLTLVYAPRSSTLAVSVVQGREFPCVEDDSCTIRAVFVHDGIHGIEKEATVTAGQAERPMLNKHFTFQILEKNTDLARLTLQFFINDYTEVGVVELGEYAPETGSVHWAAAQDKPNLPCPMWHKLALM